MRRLLTLIAALALSGILAPGGSQAAAQCSDTVLADWFEDGRIDRIYALPCYEDAIAALPADLRDYTDASDVIGRALTSAARGQVEVPSDDTNGSPVTGNALDPSSASTFPLPLPLVLLFGLAVAVLAAGGLSSLARLRRGR